MLENGEEGARTRDVDILLCRMKAAAVGIAFSVVSAEACASPCSSLMTNTSLGFSLLPPTCCNPRWSSPEMGSRQPPDPSIVSWQSRSLIFLQLRILDSACTFAFCLYYFLYLYFKFYD
jgi:hypothetical protein